MKSQKIKITFKEMIKNKRLSEFDKEIDEDEKDTRDKG